MNKYIHAAPNFSEGRNTKIIDEIINTVRNVLGVKLIGFYPDTDFNRTVVELIGKVDAMKSVLVNLASKAIELIDMEKQSGEHVRIGAHDTIPIFPARNITIEECVMIAEEIGIHLNKKTGVPIFFSGENARIPEKKAIDFIRKGQYEGLRDIFINKIPDPKRMPDLGDIKNFKHKGGTIISASSTPLVAINYILNTNNLDIAKAIAKAVRGPSGGLTNVRAVGLMFTNRDRAVVSMNLFNNKETPIHRTYNLVNSEAAQYNVQIERTQLIGTLSQEVLIKAAEYFLQLDNFDREQIRENHIPDLQ